MKPERVSGHGVVTADRHPADRVHLGALARVQGGDHHAVADVDAHVAAAVLQHQVAGLRGAGALQGAGLGVRGARQADARLGVHPLGEARAVPGAELGAAVDVGGADAAVGGLDDRGARAGQRGDVDRRRRLRRGGGGLGARRRAAGPRDAVGQVAGGDPALGAVVVDLGPAVGRDAGGGHRGPLRQGGDPVVLGAGAGADVQRDGGVAGRRGARGRRAAGDRGHGGRRGTGRGGALGVCGDRGGAGATEGDEAGDSSDAGAAGCRGVGVPGAVGGQGMGAPSAVGGGARAAARRDGQGLRHGGPPYACEVSCRVRVGGTRRQGMWWSPSASPQGRPGGPVTSGSPASAWTLMTTDTSGGRTRRTARGMDPGCDHAIVTLTRPATRSQTDNSPGVRGGGVRGLPEGGGQGPRCHP
ncbi:hypothetical protein SDC9_101196 [bioreactor metagenome]|uniref:Uncharacterized protein n=1 Tax=bioreactor metagenome TaxID=1076179 RepID=A0A645ANS7_9ZZZZ